MSSDILERSKRGFSFQRNEILDMRYNPNKQILTAQEILNYWPLNKIIKIFYLYGEEKFARRIAQEIIQIRKKQRIYTTKQLRQIINDVLDKSGINNPRHKIKTLARIFQPLRITVNNELENLKSILASASDLLKVGGRIVVISYQSLEDRIVKQYFKNCSLLKILTKKPVLPSKEEITKNPRSRSAKLRAAIKI